MTKMIDAALGYARRGWPIFPCNSIKEPYVSNGVLDATTDEKIIKDWWSNWPKANIGLDCAGAGFMVLDLDPGHDWGALESNVGAIPDTQLTQRTPRGGEHLFFEIKEDEVVSPSASKLSDNVDVRSFHSYVLLAPSQTTDGHYVWEGEGKPAFRSDEMVRLANAHREKHEDRDTWLIEADLPENVERAIKWLKNEAAIAVQGRGGDHTAYATAAMMKSFGVSQALAFDLMWEHWNPRNVPPWSAEEADHLEAKVQNGYSYNTSPPGNMTDAYHVARKKAMFSPVKKTEEKGKGVIVEAKPWTFRDRAAVRSIKPPQWLIGDMIAENSYSILFGAPGSLKTFVALDLALRVATGTKPLWMPDVAVKQGKVLFAIGEGIANLHYRLQAWEANNPTVAGIRDNFFEVDPVPKVTHELEPFLDGALELSDTGFDLIVIDTIGRAMQGANENSQEDASTFTAMIECLQRELGATVLAVGHTGHDNKERMRGSMVFFADADTQIRIDRKGEDMEVLASMTKQKDADPWEKAKRIGFEKVTLSEERSSLTAVAPEERKAGATDKAKEETSGFILLLDVAVRTILSNYKLKEFSDRELADIVAMRDDVEIGSEALRRRHLKRVREVSGTYSSRAYDPVKKRWRYRD